jgi:hypothetical protein
VERHPAVSHAAAVPDDDDIKGQKPVAFVILRNGEGASEDDLKRLASALRLVRRRAAARLDQQGRSCDAASDGDGTDAGGRPPAVAARP